MRFVWQKENWAWDAGDKSQPAGCSAPYRKARTCLYHSMETRVRDLVQLAVLASVSPSCPTDFSFKASCWWQLWFASTCPASSSQQERWAQGLLSSLPSCCSSAVSSPRWALAPWMWMGADLAKHTLFPWVLWFLNSMLLCPLSVTDNEWLWEIQGQRLNGHKERNALTPSRFFLPGRGPARPAVWARRALPLLVVELHCCKSLASLIHRASFITCKNLKASAFDCFQLNVWEESFVFSFSAHVSSHGLKPP